MTSTVAGEDANVKLGACTETVTFELALNVPEVPVMVTVWFAEGAELLAVNVRTEDAVAGFGENDAVTPVGKVDETARLTLPVNPPASVIDKVAVPMPPGLTGTVLCALASQKPGTCGPARSSIRL